MSSDSPQHKNCQEGNAPGAAGGDGFKRPVCLITHEFYPTRGGIATFSEEIARAGAALGHNIEVWAQLNNGAERRWPFPVRRIPVRGTHGFACRARLALELIHHRRYLRDAVVYLSEPAPLLAMMSLQFFSGFLPKRLIVTFYGSEILRFHRNPLYRALTRRLIKNAARISTVSEFTRDLLCQCFPEAADKTITTPGALRSKLEPEGEDRPADTAPPPVEKLPVEAGPGRRVVLTVGRLHPRKGQIYTLRALQALPEELRKNTEYWLVGKTNGSDYEKELRAASARDTALTVRFLGELSDSVLGRIYERADVFALTSVNYRRSVEGFGLVYLEASAHGLPIVAHGVGGVGEAVVDGKTGFIVAPPTSGSDDISALTVALKNLLCDTALRQQMGAAGREHAALHSWKKSAEKLFAPLPAIVPRAARA